VLHVQFIHRLLHVQQSNSSYEKQLISHELVLYQKGSMFPTIPHDISWLHTAVKNKYIANGPRDAAPCKIDHIALPIDYNYQATSVGC